MIQLTNETGNSPWNNETARELEELQSYQQPPVPNQYSVEVWGSYLVSTVTTDALAENFPFSAPFFRVSV